MEEQDRYREIIDRRDMSEASEAVKERVLAEGWKAILDIMRDCSCPPCDEDRKTRLNIDWSQTVNRIKLERIRDKDARSSTYFLNSLIEQTQRIRAMAMFVERVGTLQGRWRAVFGWWANRSKLIIIHDEAIQMGMDERVKSLRKIIEAIDGMADLMFSDVWEGSPREDFQKIVTQTLSDMKAEKDKTT